MRKAGFVRSHAGYSFPGLDQKSVTEAAKFVKLSKLNPKVQKPKKDPKLSVPPINSDGSVGVDFNQEMVAPKEGSFLS